MSMEQLKAAHALVGEKITAMESVKNEHDNAISTFSSAEAARDAACQALDQASGELDEAIQALSGITTY